MKSLVTMSRRFRASTRMTRIPNGTRNMPQDRREHASWRHAADGVVEILPQGACHPDQSAALCKVACAPSTQQFGGPPDVWYRMACVRRDKGEMEILPADSSGRPGLHLIHPHFSCDKTRPASGVQESWRSSKARFSVPATGGDQQFGKNHVIRDR